MLTEREKHGIAEMLHRMEKRDLNSLAATVTSRLIVPETSGEAVEAIILHTDRSVDLLKRRKVRKEFLFKYLHDKRVSIEVTADKQIHVQRVLELWDSSDTCESNDIEDESGAPPAPVPSRNASHTSLCSLDTSVTVNVLTRNDLDTSVTVNVLTRNDASAVNELRRADSNISVSAMDERSNSPIMFSIDSSSHTSLHHAPPPAPAPSQPQAQEMANNFVRWYFQLLNETAISEKTDFGPSHFWPDASAKVELLRGDGEAVERLEVTENAEEVCRMLIGVMRRHQLQHNPNLCDEGVRGRLNPHGLVLVLACGTLHNQHTVCGVFEQVFGLIRDPGAQNNWKIKYTEARLVARSVSEQPSLANSTLYAIAYS